MIELIDLEATIKFIPESEKKSKKPTTFYIKPPTWRGSIKKAGLYNLKQDGGKNKLTPIPDDQAWFDYVVSRIDHIDNVGDLAIEDVLSRLSEEDGSELFLFIWKRTNLNESQSKN